MTDLDAALARIATLLAALEREAEHEPVVRVLLRRMPEVAAARSALEASAVPTGFEWADYWDRRYAAALPASAVPEPTDRLDRDVLREALFASLGWPTRQLVLGGVGDFPSGIKTGDPDNPEWAFLAATVAMKYESGLAATPPGPHTSREETP